jgi:hypothetical protein
MIIVIWKFDWASNLCFFSLAFEGKISGCGK